MDINAYARQMLKSLSTVKSSEVRKAMLKEVAKTLQGKDVKKTVDPDLQNAIAEIASMFDSLQMMAQAEGEVEMDANPEEPVENAAGDEDENNEPDPDETDEDKIKRLELEKADLEAAILKAEGSTGSDDAEDRKDEDQPDASAESVAEVSKTQNTIMNTLLINGLKDIAKSIAGMNEKVNDQGTAIENMLKDFGVDKELEEINKNAPKKPVTKAKPVLNTDDAVGLLASINEQLSQANGKEVSKAEKVEMGKQPIRKNLRPALSAFLTYKPSNN